MTEEFIPHLEKRFRLANKAYARFLTGHSSGGWSTLWLQVSYPDFFGGTWSTAPDPVDLRSFTGIDATPGSTDNAYRERDGSPKQLVRRGGIHRQHRRVRAAGRGHGRIRRPVRLVRVGLESARRRRPPDENVQPRIGRVESRGLEILAKLRHPADPRKNWTRLAPKLKGKINVICGDADTFRLEEAVKMLCGFFKEKAATPCASLCRNAIHESLSALPNLP